MKIFKNTILVFLLACAAPVVFAAVYKLGPLGDELIGQVSSVVVQDGENFHAIAHRHDVGYVELMEANPGVDPLATPAGTVLIIPTRYILPNVARQGVVINLAEMRMYYYPKNSAEVWTFPVGIGRLGTQTPDGAMKVIEHLDHPTWHAPASVIADRAKEGVVIPKIVPPGPDNPLGEFALRLSRPTYLIHGTNDNSGVGRRSSAGCIRMYPEDISKLFHEIKKGESVVIINEPYKLGRHNDYVYVEGHLPLQEVKDNFQNLDKIIDGYLLELGGSRAQQAVDMKKALRIASQQQGLPQRVGQLSVVSDENPVEKVDQSAKKDKITYLFFKHNAG